MAKNVNSLQSGMVDSNPVNTPSVDHMRGRNMFPQSFMHPSTCRYGEVDPVLAFKCERGDVLPYKFVTDLNTFTLASPLKSKVDMYSAAFKVPMEALYPRNWDIMQPFPTKGDDVPEDTRALLPVKTFAAALTTGINQSFTSKNLNGFVRNTILREFIYSAGSLFSKFNYHFDGFKSNVSVGSVNKGSMTHDRFFDTYFAPWLLSVFDTNTVLLEHYDGETPDYRPTSDISNISSKFDSNGYYVSYRRALELLRTGEYSISAQVSDDLWANAPKWAHTGNSVAINIEPIIAYNCACSHFFNNPKIDYIYSWELYRDNMQSLVYQSRAVPTFTWNGVLKQYDVFSKNVMMSTFGSLTSPTSEHYLDHTSFWFNLLGFHRSLRYGDYFTGVHPEPLAVGDINAPVVDGSVNAIEMTKRLQLTRLLNKVNIAGPRKDDQLVALYGGPLPDAPKDVPIRLSLEQFNISGFEVNNTGDLQASDDATNITTTNLRLTDSKFMFEAAIDEPCWIIAVQYFEAHRIYTRTLDRFAFHRDRMDDFQPDLQYIGDQDVKSSELDAVYGNDEVPFAYNLRNMEYKQRYSYASGGFIDYLPTWLFITDNTDGNPASPNITPDYIRSSPSEFDRFYKSLLGWSLASYFHFITTNTNVLAPYRQMIYAPEILA